MIRPLTFITALMFVLSGAYLFAVKHRSQTLDDQIAQVSQATRLDEQRIRVLQAQWALEVDPSRLQQLSTEFTTLQPMKPSQMMTLASLRSALPPVGGSAPGGNPENTMPVADTAVATNAAGATAPAGADKSQNSAAAPVQFASLGTAAAPRASARNPSEKKLAANAQPRGMNNVEAVLNNLSGTHHPLHERHSATRPAYAEARPEFTPASALAPQPVSSGMPMGAQVMSVRAVAAAPAVPPMSGGGSMLGMAQTGSGN
jgi:hypothetical protein